MSKSKARFLAELLSSDGKVIKTKSQASTIIVSDLPTIPNSKLANSSVTIAGEGLSLGASLTLDTGDVTEHTAYKYYTDTRARASISATGSLSYDKNTGVMSFTMPAQNTSNITEGSNLYYTDTRARAAISATGSLSYNSTTGVMSFTMPAQNTSNITEGSNLYYTNARADARIVNAGSANWNTAYGWGNHASAGYSTTATTYSVQDGELSQNNFTNADHSKLDGIAASANNYSHPSNHAISVITGLQTALDGKVDDSQVLTNVPSGAVFTDTNTTYSVGDGGLSQNNFTNADHTKLNAIEASADVTDSTNVVAALTAGTNITISAGGTIASTDTNTTYSVGDGGLSQNNFTNADHSKLDGIATGATNTAAPHYTSAIAVGDGGLTTNNFTTTLKNKLDGIAASANNYVLPSGYATESYVGTQISNLVDSSPAALNTLNELAAAIGDDASFSTTVTNNIATKLPLAGGALTGAVTTNSTFDGRNVSVDGTKLDTIATSANNYVLPFTNNSGNWNTAYGWGNHASGGYAPASHNHSGVYLPIAGKAADSNLLDGIDSTGFVRQLGDSSTGPNYLDPSSRRVNPNASNPTNVHYAVSTFGNFGNVSGQLATHYVSGAAYTRGYNSAWSAWRTQWDSLNDGAGSGLDADLLDGQQGSYYATASGLTTATATANAALPKAGGTITGNLNVNGTTTLGNGNADQTHINDTLYLGATDSGDSHFYFGENSSNWYGDHWYWDSGYEVERNSRYAGTDTLIEKHDTRYTHKVQTNRAYERLAHSTGYQIGSYNSVGDNSYKTNPIYVIGDSYRPSDTSVSNMYGTGYSNVNLWGNSGGKPAGWGHYVVEGGTYVHITSNGGTWSLNEFNRNGNKVWDAGNDGGGSGLDADLLDGQQGSYYAPNTSLGNYVLKGGHTSLGATWKTTFYSGSGGATFGANHYSMGVDVANGSWSGPNYSDLIIGYHTGIRIGAAYGGTKFYNNSPTTDTNNDGEGEGTEALLMTVGGVNGGSGVKIQNALIIAGAGTQQTIDTTTHSLEIKNSGATGSGGLVLQGSSGTHGLQLYWDTNGSYYGFLDAAWANWDIQKARNGAFKVDEGSGLQRVWNAGNDGAGSGLDADLLDGNQASAFATSAQGTLATNALPKAGGTMTGTLDLGTTSIAVDSDKGFVNSGPWTRNTTPYGYIALGPANTGHAHIYTNLSNFYFNVNTMYQNGNLIWAANNDGAGSGLDADLLDGLNLHTGRNNEANKVVRTNSSGYIDAGWINTTSGSNTTQIPTRFYASDDAYIRYYDRSYMQNHLGLSGKTSFVPRSASNSSEYYRTGSQGWGGNNLNDFYNRGSCFVDVWSGGLTGAPPGSHWNGFQAMHYSSSNTYHHGMRLLMNAGNPANTYLQGWWANGGSGYSAQKIWTDGNDGAGSGLVADYATKVTFNTQGNSNTTLKLLLGDTTNSTIAAGTVYKDNELSYNTSSNTLNTGSINFSNWNYQAHLNSSGSSGPSTHYYVTQHSNGSNAYQSGWNGTVASQGASNLRTLGVSSTGELSNDIVEQTFTMTRAQFNAMSVGQNYPAFTFSNSRGSNPGRAAIVFEVILCMRYTSYSSAALSSTSGKIMRLTSHNYTQNKIIAEFRADSVSNMTQSSFNNSLCSFLYQDRESRLYHCENDINFVKFTSATLGSHVTSLTVKVRYKMYDGASF